MSEINNLKLSSVNSYAKIILPLLDAMNWHGDQDSFLEALPYNIEEMDIEDFFNTMANLNFLPKESLIEDQKISQLQYPLVWFDQDNNPLALIKPLQSHVLAFCSVAGEYKQIPFSKIKGKIITLTPIKNEREQLQKESQSWFLWILKRFKSTIILALLLTFFLSILAIISPLMIMGVFNQISAKASTDVLTMLALGMGIYLLAYLGFRILRNQVLSFVSVRLSHIVGQEVFKRILYLPPSYTEIAPVSNQLTRVKDFEGVQDFFAGSAFASILEIPFLSLLFILLGFFSLKLLWVPFIIVGVFIALIFFLLPLNRQLNTLASESRKNLNDFYLELFSYMNTIKNARAQNIWLNRFTELNDLAIKNSHKVNALDGFINTFSHLLISLAGILTLVLGVFEVVNGNLTTPGLIAVMFIIWRILAPFRTIFSIFTQFGRIKRSVEQLDRFIQMPQENRHDSTSKLEKEFRGNITFSQVSLRYSSDSAPALLGVSFDLKSGEALQVVGHGGSGKTSLLKLLLGLYGPQTGRVLIDNINVKQINPIKLRHSIAYLPQQIQRFPGTIRDFFKMINPSLTEDHVFMALEKVNLKEIIADFRNGLDTEINSISQKNLNNTFLKKLYLSTLFVGQSHIYLLDGPERFLSNDELEQFVEALAPLLNSSTFIIISSSPIFTKFCKKMLWLDQGKVKAFGESQTLAKNYFNFI